MRLPGLAARLWPRTLAAQIPLVVALALAVAQILNVFLLMGERQIAALGARATLAERVCSATALAIARAPEPPRQADLRRLATPSMTFFTSQEGLPNRPRLVPDPALAERVRGVMAREGMGQSAIAAATRKLQPNPRAPQGVNPLDETFIAFRFAANAPWYVCHVVSDPPEKFLTLRLIGGTLLLFAIVLGVTLLVTRRIVRPLSDLSATVTRVGKAGDRSLPIRMQGPAEIGAVVAALNELGERVRALLQEKDAMLGAIGHDLRTPLTALRIRAENLPEHDDTRRMIALIDHLSHMLNAIIGLAKVGHDPEPPVPTDIVALATAIVEEFEDLGNDVRLLPSLPIVHALRPHLFMQLLRNIVDNAVKYGQRARLRLNQADGTLFIRVEDDGPGIDPADIERLMKPFERLESSRNRETGGTGLGLAMARIITGMHDAALSFDKIDGQAFAVTIRVPAGAPRAQTESR